MCGPVYIVGAIINGEKMYQKKNNNDIYTKKKKKKKLKLCQIIQVVTIHHFIFKGGDLQNHVLKRKTRIFDSKEIPVQAPKDLDFLSF